VFGYEDYVAEALEGATPFQRMINQQEFKNKKVFDGAYIDFQFLYDTFLNEIKKVLDKNTPLGITMDDVLKDGLMIGCPDEAVRDITKPQKNGFVTYTLTILSR
jgi:hypothetical protein